MPANQALHSGNIASLSVFDLHCDTSLAMYRANTGFRHNACHLSFDKLQPFQNYAQIAAVFCPQELSDDEGYRQFFLVMSHLRRHLDDCATIVVDGDGILAAWSNSLVPLLPAVEDARILAGQPERLLSLYQAGVRVLTLLWSGVTCIGGSHDTQEGLTEFGQCVARDCFRLGIVPDASHASEASTDQLLAIAEELGKPCIASHSDAYAVCSHSRNLHDRHFLQIRSLGGVVGLSLCPAHLGGDSVTAILAHAEHYLELGGEDILCLGCDLDGTELPEGMLNVSDLIQIAELFAQQGWSDELIQKIFYRNALRFFTRQFINQN